MRFPLTLLALCLAWSGLASPADPPSSPCKEGPEELESAGYKVRAIEAREPKLLVPIIGRKSIPDLPLRPNDPFRAADFENTRRAFAERIRSESEIQGDTGSFSLFLTMSKPDPLIGTGARSSVIGITAGKLLSMQFISAGLENCRDRKVDIVFHVFRMRGIPYRWWGSVAQPDTVARAMEAGMSRSAGPFTPSISFGLDTGRREIGGTRATWIVEGGLFNRADFAVEAAENGALTEVSISGSHEFRTGFLSRGEWRLGHQYSKSPVGWGPFLKRGTVFAGFSGVSRPLKTGFSLRAGVDIESGNRQSSMPSRSPVSNALLTSPNTIANSGYGAVKGYLASSIALRRHLFMWSYGSQLGSSSQGGSLDFWKQVADFGYTARFYPKRLPHRPVRLELRATGGTLWRLKDGPIPVAERFYGGATVRDFIPGDSWRIPEGPIIRSFPMNRFTSMVDGIPIGSSNFFSLNSTLTHPVWVRPAIPGNLVDVTELRRRLASSLSAARRNIILKNLTISPAFTGIQPELDALLRVLTAAAEQISAPPTDSSPAPQGQEKTKAFENLVNGVRADILTAKSGGADALPALRSLAVGFGATEPAELTQVIEALAAAAEKLQQGSPERKRLETTTLELADARRKLEAAFNDLMGAGKAGAQKDLIEVAKALSGRLKELRGLINRSPSSVVQQRLLERVSLASSTTDRIATSPDDPASEMESLVRGFPPLTAATLREIREDADNLAATLGNDDARQVRELASNIAKDEEKARHLLAAKQQKAVRAAQRDIAAASTVLDFLLRELNLKAISPYVLADAARVTAHNNAVTVPIRYAAGGGVRLTFASVSLSLGYAWNLNQRALRPVGAGMIAIELQRVLH